MSEADSMSSHVAEYDVLVLGAGAAGLLAASVAAERGRSTLLLEKNRQPGVKILMSGGTRCNLTQNTDVRGIVDAYGDQGRFLHSALAGLSPRDLVALMEAEGVPTKVEETNKIFPVSDQAADVVDALVRRLKRSGAQLALGEPAISLDLQDNAVWQIRTTQRQLRARSVIVTTGGLSYPGCGTTGDGLAWARALGHTIVPTRPALTPLTTNEAWARKLSGITLPDVAARVVASSAEVVSRLPVETWRSKSDRRRSDRVVAHDRGSLLFTHFGLSGPVMLNVSRAVSGQVDPREFTLRLDFLPAIALEQLDQQWREECAADGKRHVLTVAARFVPRRLAEALWELEGLDAELRCAELSKRDRLRIVQRLKDTPVSLSGTLGYRKAEVTAGGVSLAEVDSRTLQSRLQPGLFFAGEVLDLDGPIGGYNFQAAFATGKLAGTYA